LSVQFIFDYLILKFSVLKTISPHYQQLTFFAKAKSFPFQKTLFANKEKLFTKRRDFSTAKIALFSIFQKYKRLIFQLIFGPVFLIMP